MFQLSTQFHQGSTYFCIYNNDKKYVCKLKGGCFIFEKLFTP